MVKVKVTQMMDDEGNIVVQEHVVPVGEADDDDDDIPDEIKELLHLTEHIHSKSNSGVFGLPSKPDKPERQDEPT